MPRTKLQGNERGGDNNEYEKRAVSVYASGGEEAVKMTGGQAATLLLQHLKQEPMPIIEERARVRVGSDIKE